MSESLLSFPHEAPMELARATVCPEIDCADRLGMLALSGIISKFGELRSVRSAVPYAVGAAQQYELFEGHRTGIAKSPSRPGLFDNKVSQSSV